MGILSGVVSYLFGLVINLLDVSISGFLGALGFDLNTFETYFPAARDYYEVITGFSVGLLFIMLIFQLFKNFGIILDMEVEDPLKLIGKTALYFGMILYSRSITDFIIKLLIDPYSIFLNTYTANFQFSLLDLLSNMIGGAMTPTFMSIVYMIMLIALGWQFLKFIIEVVERYIVFYFVLYCAPVVLSTGAFKSTAQILKSWTRMLASQSLLLLINIWSVKLFTSFMLGFNFSQSDIIFYFLLGYGFLKFAQKADTILRILGMNTASTGDVMRSLGGAVFGITQALRTVGGIAGKMFGGGRGGAGSTNGAAQQSGSGAASSGSSGSGPSPGPMGSPGSGGNQASANSGQAVPSSNITGGVTDTVTGTAKENYTNSVLTSARQQMGRQQASDSSIGKSTGQEGTQAGGGDDNPLGDTMTGKAGEGSAGKEPIGMTAENGEKIENNQPKGQIDADTREGLANLAHGLPHTKYNPEKRSYEGGGFAEFTGENANMIGASQLTPADGYKQSTVKMPDGSVGTLYKNGETGDSHIVQFGSVDNGVMQGSISSVDPESGKMSDRMAFKAVHESVPGAATFSGHSVPVADSEGGSYHLSTGASTSFFAPGNSVSAAGTRHETSTVSPSPAASDFSAGGTNPMRGSSGGSPVGPASISSDFSPSSTHTGMGSTIPNVDTKGSPVSVNPPTVGSGMGDSISQHTESVTHDSRSVPSSSAPAADNPASSISQAESAVGSLSTHSTNTHTVNPGMRPQQNEVRRFSKDNPANVEVFRRDSGNIEAFHRTPDDPGNIQNMDKSK